MEKMDAYLKIKHLVGELNKHTELYDKGVPEISDKEWDDMYFELVSLEREYGYIMPDSPTQNVTYTVVNELQKVKHNHPMLSLDKTKDWVEFLQYFTHIDASKAVVGMLKLDGLTCSLRYVDGKLVSAETRGNGEEGEDILHNAMVVKNIPKKIDYPHELVVDGEIICDNKNFKQFENEYANPRNFASGSIRLLNSKECSHRGLKFILWNVIVGPYKNVMDNFNMMQKLGFTVTPWTSSFDLDAKEFLIEEAEAYGYPIDGLVGRFNDQVFGESLGATGHHSRAAYAFKFYDELYETKLIDVEWTMGKTNTLTPTAIFETVNIDGTDVSKASLHNISIIKKLGLTNNCTVMVYRANQIIPQINSCLRDGNGDVEIPNHCPVCGCQTSITKDNDSEVLVCTNKNCAGQLLGKLTFFVSKQAMNIDGLSEATLEKFISLGWLTKFLDIYYLDVNKEEMCKLDGFGEKSVNKLLDAIEQSKNVKLENFITALSIPNIGKSAAKTIANAFGDIYAVLDAYDKGYDWTQLDDFGDTMSQNINKYFANHIADVYNLANEMNFLQSESKEVTDNPLNGKNVAVTGKLIHFTRDSINAKLESLGAKPASGVTAKTHYLINNDPTSNSSKNKKANELNIHIITEDEFLKMCGE